MKMKDNIFSSVFSSYFRAKNLANDSRHGKMKKPLFIDIDNELWENLDSDSNVEIFEPEMVKVRGETGLLPKTRRAFGNDDFKGYIDKDHGYINIILKFETNQTPESVILKSGTNILSIKDIEYKEVCFSVLESGQYSVEFIDKTGNSNEKYDFIIKS